MEFDINIFEVIPIPATMIDKDGYIRNVNTAFIDYARRRGRSIKKEDRIGHPISPFGETEEERERIDRFCRSLLSDGSSHHFISRSIEPSTQRAFYVDVYAEVLRDSQGEIAGGIIFRRELTTEMWLELRKQVVSHMRDLVWHMHKSSDIESVLFSARHGLRELGIRFHDCGVNIIKTNTHQVNFHSMTHEGRWIETGSDQGAELLLRIWKEESIHYRPNLEMDDPDEEAHYLRTIFNRPIRCVVDVPFSHGTLALNSTQADAFSHEDMEILLEMASVLSEGFTRADDFRKLEETYVKLEQSRLQLIETLEKELQTAHDLQMGLMPTESPQIQGFDIAGRCIPANQVGGDFFQYFPISDNSIAISLADVTGHGMEAAVPVMMFSGILDSQMEAGNSLEDLFAKLNRSLYRNLYKRTLVCFTMGELDTATRKLRLSNGGGPYPYHYKAATGEIVELQVEGYPLGVRADTTYPVIETQLESGDRVVFCSDGIIEAGNSDEEMFGFERAAETIKKGCKQCLSAPQLLDYMINEVKTFTGDTPQGDDQTVVVLAVEA